MTTDSHGEVTLVDEYDAVVGSTGVLDAHRGSGKLHRAISAYLFRVHDGRLELMLQQRSRKKIVGAHQWANTVCGNVRPDEDYYECALRRLDDELGITDVNPWPIYRFRYQVRCNSEFSENEIDRIFFGWYDADVRPNPDQVQDYQWVAWDEIVEMASSDQSTMPFAPWFTLMLKDDTLLDRLVGATKINRRV